ncbi:MAG: hypothetical protein B7Y25_06340 [Alphaproteobacteria bacterium 16-39-46]|nr:MAG: hypothetical protein B7Y25_06340 [Alphaproteobacteria bacterium 16-39-46]OZA42321.1 MAG: hypothetical protein B7X84_06410 [Alphaproteobacteria bacterium 17-39-52]HQS84527.1 hypothetical protein [Alphaproteobacteria bacterium]HQS94320.1 hypothetical protein [Alphaproteobacteria bacterium]
MALFSKKYIFPSLFLSLLGGLFSSGSHGMDQEEAPCIVSYRSPLTLKELMREECSSEVGLFSLMPFGKYSIDWREEREKIEIKEKINKIQEVFNRASRELLSEELQAFDYSREAYLKDSRDLILKGENDSEIERRRPFLVAIAASEEGHWRDAGLALALLAPHGNFYKHSSTTGHLRRHVLLSIAEDLFCSPEERNLAFLKMDMALEDYFSQEEQLRYEEAIRSFDEDVGYQNLLKKRIEKATKDLKGDYRYGIGNDIPEKITMRRNTSISFLAHVIEDESVDLDIRFEIAEYLSQDRKGYTLKSGKSLSEIGLSFFLKVGENFHISSAKRLDALSCVLNHLYDTEKMDRVRHNLLSIAQNKDNPSEDRLRALKIAAIKKEYQSVPADVITLGYSLLEEILLNPRETLEIRQNARKFFTAQGSLYGMSHSRHAPYFTYHRPVERETKDEAVLLSVIKDPIAPMELRRSAAADMPWHMKESLLKDLEGSSL